MLPIFLLGAVSTVIRNKAQLLSTIAYTDQVNTFGSFLQTFGLFKLTTSTAPGSPVDGQFYFSNVDGRLYRRYGSNWITDPYAYQRNLIINGEFIVGQRNTIFTSVASAAYTLDRWQYNKVGSSLTMTHDVSQSSDVPTLAESGTRFRNSLLIDCTASDSTISSDNANEIIQKIEGYRWVLGDQKELVLSFWCKHTKTGTYSVAIINSAANRSCIGTYTQTTTNTWEKKTITFPASPSAGSWNYDTGIGAYIVFAIAVGSTYTSSTTGSYISSEIHANNSQVNACDSTSNNFMLTGVQLEVGTNPTEFEQLNFAQTLSQCQRYYCKSFSYVTPPAQNTGISPGLEWTLASGANVNATISFPVEMVKVPTITTYSRDAATSNWTGTGTPACSTGSISTRRAELYGSGATDAAYYGVHWAANAEI